MKTVAFHTLGCKVNQYDTQAMLEKFRATGYEVVPFDAAADVYVINTCTVTGTGDKKSLQLTRRLRREHPESQIILAGCLAQRKGEELLDTGANVAPGIDVNRIEPICTATPEYVCTYLKRLEEIGCKSAVLAWDAMRMGEDVLDAIASR